MGKLIKNHYLFNSKNNENDHTTSLVKESKSLYVILNNDQVEYSGYNKYSDEHIIGDDEIGIYVNSNLEPIDNFLPMTNDDIQHFVKSNIAPYNADSIAIYKIDSNGNPIGGPIRCLSIENIKKPFGTRLYRVGLCSDIHYNDETYGDSDPETRPSDDGSEYHTDTHNVFDYYQNKQEVEFICTSGDVGTNSINHDRNFKLMLNKYAPDTPFFSCYGNHDYCASNKNQETYGDEGFNLEEDVLRLRTYHWNNVIISKDPRFVTHHYTDDKNSELYANYWFERKINNEKSDIYFFLSVDYDNTRDTATMKVDYNDPYVQEIYNYVGNLNNKSSLEKTYDFNFYNPGVLVWFKDLLQNQFRNKRVFVFTHLFFVHKAGTYNGLMPIWYSYGKDSGRITSSSAYIMCGIEFDFLNKLNNEFSNTIWFTGHSHYSWEWQKFDKNINITNSEYEYVHPRNNDFSNYSTYRYMPKFKLKNISTPYKEVYYTTSTNYINTNILYAKFYPNSKHYGHNITIHGTAISTYTKDNGSSVTGGGNPGDRTSCYLYVVQKSDSISSEKICHIKQYFRIDDINKYSSMEETNEFMINCTLNSYPRLEIGIHKEKTGTNWHCINIFSVYDNDLEEYIYNENYGVISFGSGANLEIKVPSTTVVPHEIRQEAEIINNNTAYNVHLPSTCRPIPLGRTSYGIRGEDSEGAIMDVYEDYVDIRGIFFKHKYITNQQFDNIIYDEKTGQNVGYINKYYALAQYRIPIAAG